MSFASRLIGIEEEVVKCSEFRMSDFEFRIYQAKDEESATRAWVFCVVDR